MCRRAPPPGATVPAPTGRFTGEPGHKAESSATVVLRQRLGARRNDGWALWVGLAADNLDR